MRGQVAGIWVLRAPGSAGDETGERVQGPWFPDSEDRETMKSSSLSSHACLGGLLADCFSACRPLWGMHGLRGRQAQLKFCPFLAVGASGS